MKNSSEIVYEYDSVKQEAEKSCNERMEVTNRRYSKTIVRKYHMTEKDMNKAKMRWYEDLLDLPSRAEKIEIAGTKFFNPYRLNGAYYSQVQALFILGANQWHPFRDVDASNDVRRQVEACMRTKYAKNSILSLWTKFSEKAQKDGAIASKDVNGRLRDGYKLLKRLGGLHPYGYKLKQVCACIDIKRDESGMYYFRLNTSFASPEDVKPYYNCALERNLKKRGRRKGV